MSLKFPNASRSFDATRRAVRFWGYDTAMECSFFATEDALRHVQPEAGGGEESFLHAFDVHRKRFEAAAARVYARGRRGYYDVRASDL